MMGCWFLNRGGQRINQDHLPFAALKLTLVVFYTLVDVPYLYLFYTGSFVSLFLVTHILAGAHPTKGAYAQH
jgi:hypothetical protein